MQGQDTLFPQNSYCRGCEWALSAYDTRHRFVTPALYDLPVGKGRHVGVSNSVVNALVGGWQVGGIWTIQSGFPITPTVGGTDRSGNGAGFDRPNATGVIAIHRQPGAVALVEHGRIHSECAGRVRERGTQRADRAEVLYAGRVRA